MAKYVYPAVFTKEANGQYSVDFPDVTGCFTGGNSLVDAIENAEDVLAMTLCAAERRGETLPVASAVNQITLDADSFATLILCDTTDYPLQEYAVKHE